MLFFYQVCHWEAATCIKNRRKMMMMMLRKMYSMEHRGPSTGRFCSDSPQHKLTKSGGCQCRKIGSFNTAESFDLGAKTNLYL